MNNNNKLKEISKIYNEFLNFPIFYEIINLKDFETQSYILIYDIESKQSKNFTLPLKFYDDAVSFILIKNRIYAIGDHITISEKTKIKVHSNKPCVIQLPYKNTLQTPIFAYITNLHFERSKIGLTQICHKFIYAIGGEEKLGISDKCEKYDIKNDKWIILPKLKYKTKEMAIGSFNSRYIYCIGGTMDDFFTLHQIQKFDTIDEENGWICLKICIFDIHKTQIKLDWINLSMDCCQIDPISSLIFGGNHMRFNIFKDYGSSAYIINTDEKIKGGCEYSSKYDKFYTIVKGNLYFRTWRYYHKFNFKSKKWRLFSI